MRKMSRLWIAVGVIGVVLGLGLSASSQLLLQGAGSGKGGGATNLLLMTDGSNKVLQTGGVAKICLASGC